MNFLLIAVLTIFLALGEPSEGAKSKHKAASEYFNLCSKKSPTFSACVKNSIEALKPQLIQGIPELNLQPIEPMVIPKMELVEGRDNFKFSMILTNLTITGLGQFTIADVKANMNEWSIEMTLKTPFMGMTAEYEMDGKILVVPIKGHGDCEMNFTDVTTVGKSRGGFVQREGKEFLQVEEFKWDIATEGGHSQFNNLFNGDKTLGPATNAFLNENWKEAFATYKSLPEEAFGVLFKELNSRVFQVFPTDEMFLD